MMRLVYSQPALDDIEGILDYIGKDKSSAAARFGEGLLKTVELLESHPEMGVRCDNLVKGLRLISYRGYRPYYRVEAKHNVVSLERVLHPSRDIRT